MGTEEGIFLFFTEVDDCSLPAEDEEGGFSGAGMVM